jgi:hypothetical protein
MVVAVDIDAGRRPSGGFIAAAFLHQEQQSPEPPRKTSVPGVNMEGLIHAPPQTPGGRARWRPLPGTEAAMRAENHRSIV